MEPIVFGKDREILLTKTKLGIGWPVPVRVAERWDPDYELMRVAAMYELLESGKYAVLLESISIELGLEKLKGEDDKLYQRATSVCQVYDLGELPEHLRDKARDLCHSMNGLDVIKFVLIGPIEFEPGPSLSSQS